MLFSEFYFSPTSKNPKRKKMDPQNLRAIKAVRVEFRAWIIRKKINNTKQKLRLDILWVVEEAEAEEDRHPPEVLYFLAVQPHRRETLGRNRFAVLLDHPSVRRITKVHS
jgi:hypothetical protein